MNWRKSVIAKKAVRYGFDVLRVPFRYIFSEEDFLSRPPILANSFPKSGTHLLIQILQAIPGVRDWGSFLASTPSFTFREIPEDKMCQKIRKIVPNELVSAHLYYSKKVEKALADKNVVHYFIYRDPRDVVVSGAHYLTFMNKWHKLHKLFKNLPDMDSRIKCHIEGIYDYQNSFIFPNIRERLMRYKKWIESPFGFSIKYEDLLIANKENIIHDIIFYYVKSSNIDVDIHRLTHEAIHNIDPKKSHTFRTGKISTWKQYFSIKNKELFKNYAGDILIELGYERDFNW